MFWLVIRSSNFQIFLNHGAEDHPKNVILKYFSGSQVISGNRSLVVIRSLKISSIVVKKVIKKCKIKVSWGQSGHQTGKFDSALAEVII